MNHINLFGIAIPFWLYAAGIYTVWVVIFLLAKRILFRWIETFTNKTSSRIDDILVDSIKFPLNLLILFSGIGVCRTLIPTNGLEEFRALCLVLFKLGMVVALILFLDRLVRSFLKEYGSRIDLLRSSGGFIQGIIRFVFLGIGLLFLLDALGISITPVWASLGIGSLAVAMGLQPTLENLFAGVQIITDGMVRIGQFVRLDSGEQGYVDKIGWRSTWIRMLPNNMVIVPNKVLVNQRVINYYYPQAEMAVLIEVGVSYDSDLARVEKVTVEVGQEVLKSVPGGVPEFTPLIRYHTFSDSGVNFTVILRAREFVDQYLLKHEFIKRLHVRYKQEGIVIPFPIRTLDLKPETAQWLKTTLKG